MIFLNRGGIMKLQRIISGLALPTIAIGALIIMSSCRPMVTPEQLQELKELRAKEKSVTEQIQAKKNDIGKVKTEISSREAELKKCNDESNIVKEKLNSWPNSWPDWSPEPPKVEEPVVDPKKKKK
jgi:peptidoglycan hydrolase CwlO-like protein